MEGVEVNILNVAAVNYQNKKIEKIESLEI